MLTDAHIAEREGWFTELGFDVMQAATLATARDTAGQLVTAHDVRRALQLGATHAQAIAIYT